MRKLGLLIACLAACGARAQTFTLGFEPSEGYSPGSIIGQPDGGTYRWYAGTGATYVQGVTTAFAHSGTQSFLMSNQVTSSDVLALALRAFAPVGEIGAKDSFNQIAQVNRVRYSFWFRSASNANDGSQIAFGLDNGGGGRLVITTLAVQGSTVKIAQQFGNSLATATLNSWHQLTMDCTVDAGSANDVCALQIDNGTAYLAATFENYYYSNSVPMPAASALIFSVDLISANASAPGIYIDDVSVSPLYADGGLYLAPPTDAGTFSSDGGGNDSGVADSGVSDAGSAGLADDGGSSPTDDGGAGNQKLAPFNARVGCDCSEVDIALALLSALVAAALRSRRRYS